MTLGNVIAEPLECLPLSKSKLEIDEPVRDTAALCELNLEHLRRFSHPFSGGQRQRICIALALVARPEFIVCDGSVSALDDSIQAGIVNLLMDLQVELGLTYLFIAHDLSVVAQISTRFALLYVGQVVGLAPTEKIFLMPRHPHTHALFSSILCINPNAAFDPIEL